MQLARIITPVRNERDLRPFVALAFNAYRILPLFMGAKIIYHPFLSKRILAACCSAFSGNTAFVRVFTADVSAAYLNLLPDGVLSAGSYLSFSVCLHGFMVAGITC